MYSRILGLTTFALILAYGTVGAFAQNQMAPQPDQPQMQSHPMGQEGSGTTMGHGSMMGGGMMGHMMGHGMMGHMMEPPPFMMRMMFALMDADGDGTISLQEFQAAHDEFSRQWTPIKTASLRWRRWKRSSMGPSDRFARGSDSASKTSSSPQKGSVGSI